MKRYGSIIIFTLILLIFISGAYASDNNDTQDVLEVSDDEVSIEAYDDNMELSSENNDDSKLKSSSEEKISSGFDELDYDTAGNWTEFKQVFSNYTQTTYTLEKDYYFKYGHEDRVQNFYGRTFTLDGQGHSIDFRDNLGGSNVGGRIDLYSCPNVVFKNIHFIYPELMNHRSNGTTFINCTISGVDMLKFQASNNIKFYNSTIEMDEGHYGSISFGGSKGWYDGASDIMGGDNNIISNCTLINMHGGHGALFFAGNNNTVLDSTFINCTVPYTDIDDSKEWINTEHNFYMRRGGGAMSFGGSGNTVDGCTFINSWSKVTGGVIYFAEGNNTVSNSNFTLETLPEYAEGITSKTGAVYFDKNYQDYTTNNIVNSTFTNFEKCGSIIYSEGGVNIEGSTFTGNNASTLMVLKGSDNNITNTTFISNTGENGGALYISNSTVRNCTFTDNHASQSGGAIYYGGNTIIDDCTFINNTATNGGAIACDNTTGNLINNSRFYNNSATNAGGAIYFNQTKDSNIDYCTFDENTAANGTAIYNSNTQNQEYIHNSTFTISKQGCEVRITVDLINSLLKVEFIPPDPYTHGLAITPDTEAIEKKDNSYYVNGKEFKWDDPQIEAPLVNKAIVIELYDANHNLLDNITLITDENGFVSTDAAKLFDDENPAKYVKAYHLEDIYYYYAEDETEPDVGDFDKLQYLVNKAGENGVVNLTRNYTYTIGVDTITEGVVIKYNNVTVNGNGYTINALNKSRIFMVTADGSKLANMTFTNAVDGALYYDISSNAVIDNVIFENNQGTMGTVNFWGGNLTISNSQFINSTAMYKYNMTNFGEVEGYGSYGLLFAYASDRISISNTNFTNSRFHEYGVKISAGEVILNGVGFSDNMAISDSYHFKAEGDYYRYVNGRYRWVHENEEKTRTVYEGYDPYGEESPFLLNINADNIEAKNIKTINDKVNRFMQVSSSNCTIKGLYAHDTTVQTLVNVVGNLTVDGMEVDNVTSLFTRYVYDYTTNETTYSTQERNYNILNIDNYYYTYEIDPETGDWINYQEGVYPSDVVIKNVKIENIDHFHDAIYARATNVTMDNVNLSNFNIEGNLYAISVSSDNANASNINFNEITLEGYGNFISFSVNDNLTLRNITLKDSTISSRNSDDLVSIGVSGDSNHAVLVDSILFKNIDCKEYNQTSKWDSTWTDRGCQLMGIWGRNAQVNMSNIDVDNCYITRALDVRADDLNINNVSIVDSSVSQNNNLLQFNAWNNLTMEDILIENVKVKEGRNIYYGEYNGRYYLWDKEIPNLSPGITAYSEGDLKVNNVNILNTEAVSQNLLQIGAYGNASIENVTVQGLTSPSIVYPILRNNTVYYDTFSGVGPNSITFASINGTLNLSGITFDDIVSGIGHPYAYAKFFLNITGANVNIDDLSVENAAIGGYIDGEAIIIDADYLTVNDLTFNKITHADALYHSYYDAEADKVIYNKYIPAGGAVIAINADKKAVIYNVNITNTHGGEQYGSLYLEGENFTVSNVLIDNITTSSALLIHYNKDINGYVEESDKYLQYTEDDDYIIYTEYEEYNEETGDEVWLKHGYKIESSYSDSSLGIFAEVENIILDNVNITNCESESEMVLFEITAGENATVSNINVKNITDKPYTRYTWNSESNTPNVETSTGNVGPRMYFYVSDGELKLYNFTACDVESAGSYTFLEVNGNAADMQNITIKDSYIGGMDYSVRVDLNNKLNVENFIVDNIHRSIMHNTTESMEYYDKYGNYLFSEEYYEAYSYGMFSVQFSSPIMNVSDVNITNIFAGHYYGTLNLEAENLTANNILLENISADPSEIYVEYNPKIKDYVTEMSSSEYNGGLKINYNGNFEQGNADLSNIKLNNIDVVMGGLFVVNDANITMENITISNINKTPYIMYDTDDKGNQYIYAQEDMLDELIEIDAEGESNDGNINIINMLVENIPCGEESFSIEGTNVSISKSTFRNIISEKSEYQFNEDTGKLELYQYDNMGNALMISAENVKVSDTRFENITLGGNEHYGKVLMLNGYGSSSLNNCTFTNIKSVKHNTTYDGNTELEDSKGSAVFFDGYENNTIIDSHFINCSSDYGGAIYITSPVNITGSTFNNNKAIQGGALFLDENAYGVNIMDSTFIKNTADINGGAIYLYESRNDTNTIQTSTFIGNHADHDGGAFFYNNTVNKLFFDDYEWFNRTAMFADGLLSYNQPKTKITDSKFENNTDHALMIIAPDCENGFNMTVTISLPSDADGEVIVNITDENGNFIIVDGEVIKDKAYSLVNGSVKIPVGRLSLGKYNVSAYHNNYNSNYDDYHNYAYHYNSTTFKVYGQYLNMTANRTIFADENLTVTSEMNNITNGTVSIIISNGTNNLTFDNVEIINGKSVYNITGLYAGDYNVTVLFRNDQTSYEISNTTQLTVLQRESQANVTVKDNVYGNITKLIVEVPKNQTGNVTVKINNQTITKEVVNGTVEFEIENLDAGNWQANVTFNENRIYKQNSTLFNFTVLQANLTANVTADNVTAFDNVTFNVDAPEDFKGNVTISINGITYYNGPANETITIDRLPIDEYTAKVSFYGDKNYNDTTVDVDFEVVGLEPEINATITNTTYPGNVTATISLSNNANGTVKIIVDGKNFTAEVTNGSVSFDLEGLSGGMKIADVQFITKDNYNKNVKTTATFTVFKANSTIRILANDRDVIVVLPENVTGNVTIYVSGKEYTRKIINGNVTLENVLEIGDNPIVAIYDGDANFTNSRNATTLAIDKYESFINATATGSIYGGIANVTVHAPINQTGRVIITVNNVTYEKELVNGEAIFEISGLDVDEYPVEVLYLGNDKYNETRNVTSFNITKANLPAVVIAENVTIMDNATFIIEHFNDFKGKVNITVDNVTYSHDINSLITIDKLAEGKKTANVVFWGDNNYNDLQLNVSFTVSRTGSTTLNVTVQDVTYNTNATAVILVSGNANGTVVLTVDGKDYEVEVKNGTANRDLGILAAGVKEVTAKFTVTDSINTNATTTTRFNVNKADSKVDITINGNDVTVVASSTGNVTVYINGVKVIRSDENPIVLIDALKTGNNTILAIYDGNENYTGSQNDTEVFVAKKDSSVNVTADPITYGDDAVITVNVGENQTGYVTISVANKTYTAKINGTQVKFTIPGLNATTYKVSVAYSGDADFENQTNATDLIVNKANLTAIVEGLNVTVNDNTTFVIENLPSDFKGKIKITVGENTYVGDAISLIHMLKLPAGTYTANATFYDDEKYNDLELNTTFTVSRVEGTVMTVNVDNVDYPHNATAIITINANANGTVVVSVNGVQYAPVEVKNGLASVELGILSAGIKEVTANFTSTDSINTNATASTRFVVNKAESSVNITTEQTDVIVNVTGGMSGNVTVYINGAKEIIPFDGNPIRLADKLQTGNNTIIVEFSGNENYTSSQNDVEMFIAKKPSFVNVTANPITYGSEAEIIVSVGENQTGYVTIEVNGKEYSAEIKDDKVVFTILGLNATTYHVTVKYSGDADFENQTNATDLIVNKANLTAIVEGLNVTVNDNTTFVIENLPSDFKGKIKITIGENTHIGDAISLIHMLKLPAGTYTANATFYDDNNYNDLMLNTTFTVSRIEGTTLNVTVQDVTYNTNATAVIVVSGNANGTVVLTVDGKDYEVEVKNGIANRDLGILAAGVKEVTAKFIVTDSINSNATATTKFTVNKANSSVEITFNNTDVTITVHPGEAGKLIVVVNGIESVYEYAAPVTIADALKFGENTVVAFYEGSENYTLSEANKTATIPKKASLVNASVQSITYGSQATIIVNVPVAQTGYVTITVDNVNHTAPIKDGQAKFNINGLKVGEYEVNVTYTGDENYSSQINATTFNVIKADLTASVIGVNVTVGDDTKFIITVPADFTGKVNITVDGITYSGNVQSLITMDKLAEGDKIAAVKFFDDANYNDLEINASFKVSPRPGPSGIVSIKSDNMTRGYNSPYDYQAAFLDENGSALKNTEVIFKVNGKEYKVKTNEDGIAQLTGAKLAVGKYNITSVNPVTHEEATNTLEIVKRIIENKDMTVDFDSGKYFKVKVIGDDGNIAPEGEIIDIYVNKIHYVAKVDKKGYAKLKINLNPKKYNAIVEYKTYKTTNKLVVKQTLKLVKKTVKVKKGKKIVIKAKVKWSNGKPVKGKKLTLKFKGKKFKAKTNAKGIAKFTIKNKKILKKLKKGKKYTYTVVYKKNKVKGKVKIKK